MIWLRSSDLAAELGLLPSGVTRMVNRLIRDGLAEKNVSEQNKREVLVQASAEGHDLVREVFQRRQQDLRVFLGSMSPADREAVVRASAVVVAAIARQSDVGTYLQPGSARGLDASVF